MNKGEFVKAMAEKAGVTVKEANVAYDAFVDVVTDALKKGDKVQLIGFGTFEVRAKAAREGINPQTKQKVKIPASKAPALKFGKAYKDLFN
jgi:DNA-binding protein HU-beta